MVEGNIPKLTVSLVSQGIPPWKSARPGHAQPPVTWTGTELWSFSPFIGCTQRQVRSYRGPTASPWAVTPGHMRWASQSTGQEFSEDQRTPRPPSPAGAHRPGHSHAGGVRKTSSPRARRALCSVPSLPCEHFHWPVLLQVPPHIHLLSPSSPGGGECHSHDL